MARILVVDENDEMRSIVRMMLTRGGHDVIAAPHAMEGLRILQHAPVDLVVVETPCDRPDGTASAESIRSAHPATPMILTAQGVDVDEHEMRAVAGRLGATLLQRPFSAEDISTEAAGLIARTPRNPAGTPP